MAAMCLVVSLAAAPIRPGVVLGESMAPEFHSGQVFLSSRVTRPETLRPDDVVLLSMEGGVLLKRIYATEGETVWGLRPVSLHEGLDRVIPPSDVPALRRLVARHPALGEVTQIQVPEGHVYVLGDSRNNSYDSRHFGPVPWESVLSSVVVKSVGRLWDDSSAGTHVARAADRPSR
jgi:signal peptidase I